MVLWRYQHEFQLHIILIMYPVDLKLCSDPTMALVVYDFAPNAENMLFVH
jgi:hypothetical protein